MKKYMFLILLLIGITLYAGIENTKHNLSKTGTGTVKSSIEDRVCIFCHTPHNASSVAPLWNRNLSSATYTLYSAGGSPTLNATLSQPTGSSKLCLSCHDGTIALNQLYAGSSKATDLNIKLTGNANIGTVLTDDHPISFNYTSTLASSDGQLTQPNSLPTFIKLQNGRVECTTCHDPHTETIMFLRNGDRLSLCSACHTKKDGTYTFNTSVHNAVFSSAPVSSSYSCQSCHKPHNAKDMVDSRSTKQLQRGVEEDLCFVCHGTRGGMTGAPVTVYGVNLGITGQNLNLQTVFDTTNGYLVTVSNITRYVNKSHDVISSAQTGNGTKLECRNCHGVHGVKRDDINTTNVIESLINPDTLQPFQPTAPLGYNGSSNYWRKFYQMNQYCAICHDGSFPTNPGGRTDLTISTATGKAPAAVSSFYSSTKHKDIPCLACHDPHGGNYFSIVKQVNWNIDGGAPFNTKRASNTLVKTGINISYVTDKQNGNGFDLTGLCGGTCHGSNHNQGTNCVRCHYHGSGRF